MFGAVVCALALAQPVPGEPYVHPVLARTLYRDHKLGPLDPEHLDRMYEAAAEKAQQAGTEYSWMVAMKEVGARMAQYAHIAPRHRPKYWALEQRQAFEEQHRRAMAASRRNLLEGLLRNSIEDARPDTKSTFPDKSRAKRR